MRRQLLHDVALRHDADDAPIGAGDNQRADFPLGQKLGRGGDVGGRLDGENLGALHRQNGFDGHWVAPCCSAVAASRFVRLEGLAPRNTTVAH